LSGEPDQKEIKPMKVEWLGHAAFLLTTQTGIRILMDPYQSGAFGGGIGYGPIDVEADLVTISHDHEDHGWTSAARGSPVVIKGKEAQTVRGVKVRRVATFHDQSGGKERGENQVTCIEADGISLCHLGDLGHSLSKKQIAAIGRTDVLLIPIGGVFTLDPAEAGKVVKQLRPRVVVPMHYKTPKCGFPIASVEEFLKGKPLVSRAGITAIEIDPSAFTEETRIVVLEHAL
jgi:L-ascorbate metabolism protein UlaG (beta-lactamase superfamily)